MKKLTPQQQKILEYLLTGKKLTVLTAITELGVYALSQRIGELKSEGYPIKTEMIKTESGKRVAEYSFSLPSIYTTQLCKLWKDINDRFGFSWKLVF
jgi:uncharacterized small protein (DUF1192 family)